MNHDVIDQRSLEMHRLVAEKVRQNPGLIRRVLDGIERYVSSPTSSDSGRRSLLEWKQILDTRPLEEILSILTEDSEEGQRLRHSTPFTGIITQEERQTILSRHEPLRAGTHH